MNPNGMPQSGVSYHQSCPVCGRSLIVNVRLLGRRVYCQHCGGGFLATDPASPPAHETQKERQRRVDELLHQAARRLCREAAIEPLSR
jgi:transposase